MLLVVSVGAGPHAQPVGSTGRVIHVEPMGQDHEAFRFRKLMADHLAQRGFTVAAEADRADLILVTTLSTPVVGGETRAYASAELRRRDGTAVWTSDFPANAGWRQARGRDATPRLAEEIAAAVHDRSS